MHGARLLVVHDNQKFSACNQRHGGKNALQAELKLRAIDLVNRPDRLNFHSLGDLIVLLILRMLYF